MARSKKFQPTRFMLPTSHYDKDRADHAVNFIQALKHTKGVWAGKPFLLFDWQEKIIRDLFGLSLIHLSVPEIPYTKIDEMGAGMYRGEKVTLAERHARVTPEGGGDGQS